ncbi:glycoside hydrolase family 32 protein [Arenibacter sp. GZD96]|uniref:glycoside hydrolase family 32 protein n=1 Tax=Aurantibrevibacter litoralis TaxID=3106030 RepID=UPI002AFE2863|nr:glycoside hydrolase family 32 protein [Arenibacter sp. GZD-96]MEA1785588.1 glycoside hydrolase family 32 protein [Arenibacter sp. GZD-96]
MEVPNQSYSEPYRPQFHFSPKEKWMNDPNGLLYNDGVYHLFYQYYPDDMVWGPMHWGHATSTDMLHWEHKPIALFPDEHGLIFSGSAVLDATNTSGFGTEEHPPIVAIYTYHSMEKEQAGKTDYQTQGIAYSLDNGDTWVKYDGNPVINNHQGMKDFRDPKVFWNDKIRAWTMLLVAGDHLQIWESPNLKDWKKESEFGKNQGAHGGVWECPDLFPLKVAGTDEVKWVLLISINPGAPNGGSGTQYFIGDFDGKTFSSEQTEDRWIDWGTDNYAGVTYNNTPDNERIFIGWMSNWDYARDTPTTPWRSAMTLPRKLSLKKIGKKYELLNYPLEVFRTILTPDVQKDISIDAATATSITLKNFNQSQVQFNTEATHFQISFTNSQKETLVLTMDGKLKQFTLDRSKSGKVDFQENFAKNVQRMPVPHIPEGSYEVRIIMDWSSVEVFINNGQYVMTSQLFPNEPYTELQIENKGNAAILLRDVEVSAVSRVW